MGTKEHEVSLTKGIVPFAPFVIVGLSFYSGSAGGRQTPTDPAQSLDALQAFVRPERAAGL